MENHVPLRQVTAMKESTFRDALMWHMHREQTSITELTRNTNVSRDVINKLRASKTASTSVENARRLSKFYGKSIENLILCGSFTDEDRFKGLFELLTSVEQQSVLYQIRGLLRKSE